MALGRTDAPLAQSTGDHLGSTPYAKALSRFIRECETPLTIGVQGEWGSGKTSIMRMIRRELSEASRGKGAKQHFFIHWFDAWQYGAVGNSDTLGLQLVSDLVEETMREIRSDAETLPLFGKMLQSLGALTSTIVKGTKVVGAAAAGGVANRVSQGLLDGGVITSQLLGEQARPVGLADLRDGFAKLIKARVEQTGDKDCRVVVFVDDLDRVRPARAVALLEVLKNFLEVPHCVFVIACDRTVVREGVRERLGIVDDEKFDAFFDKLFQVPFQMPTGGYDNLGFLRGYVAGMLTARLKGWPKQKIEDQATFVASRASRAVEVAIGNNPRALKRFFNVADLMLCVDEQRTATGKASSRNGPPPIRWNDPYYAVTFLVVVAMQTRWPDIVGYIALLESAGSFTRALNTMLGEDVGDELDEELEGLLSGLAPRGEDWRECAELQAVPDFAAALVEAIDRQPDQKIDDKEFAVLRSWLVRLVSSGVRGGLTYKTGLFRFRDGILKVNPSVGDAVMGMVRGLDAKFSADSRFDVFRSASRFSVKVKGVGRKSYSPLAIYIGGASEKKQIMARLGLGPKVEASVDLQGLRALGDQFIEKTKKTGSKWEKHGEGYRLDFVDSKMSHESMSDLREAILELYEGCAALQESVRSASPIVPRELPDEEVSRGTSDSEEEVASKPAENSDVLEQPSSSDSKED